CEKRSVGQEEEAKEEGRPEIRRHRRRETVVVVVVIVARQEGVAMSRCSSTFVAAIVALAGASCTIPVGDGELGQLRVAWTFGNEPRCAAVGVENVSVQVVGAAGTGGAQAQCTAGAVVIPDLPAGNYKIFVDAQGTLAWQGSAEHAVVGGNVADAGTVKLQPVVGAGGASLSLQWS